MAEIRHHFQRMLVSLGHSQAKALGYPSINLRTMEISTIGADILDLKSEFEDISMCVIFSPVNLILPGKLFNVRGKRHMHFSKKPPSVQECRALGEKYLPLIETILNAWPKASILILPPLYRSFLPICDCKKNLQYTLNESKIRFEAFETAVEKVAQNFKNVKKLPRKSFYQMMLGKTSADLTEASIFLSVISDDGVHLCEGALSNLCGGLSEFAARQRASRVVQAPARREAGDVHGDDGTYNKRHNTTRYRPGLH